MLHKIALLTCHNLYESKQHFTLKLAEALQRHGIQAKIFTWPHGPVPDTVINEIQAYHPEITCSFHQLPPQSDGHYFWDKDKRLHWTILVDPAFYDLELMSSPYSILSCVDRSDCDLLHSYHFQSTFFWPHAVEKDLEAAAEAPRDIDVILLGTCYDPDTLRAFWQKSYSKEVSDVLDDAVEIVLSDNSTSFFRALLQALTLAGIDPHEVEFDQLAYYVDSYSRGIDRLQLVRSIKDVPIHVYGSTCWREEKPIRDWSYYLAGQSNVIIHPPVPYVEALQLLKRSKICLNSMPFFKNGTHERIFAALACGALPLTSDNMYVREILEEDKEILFYKFTALEEVNAQVVRYVHDDVHRHELVKRGQAKVKAFHTWDNRVETLLHLPMFSMSTHK